MVIAGGRAAKLSKHPAPSSVCSRPLSEDPRVEHQTGAGGSVFNIYNCPPPPFPLISRFEESGEDLDLPQASQFSVYKKWKGLVSIF